MPTLLVEIGCEELPASTCRSITRELPSLCREHIGSEPEQVFVGPRRLALLSQVPDTVEAGPMSGPPRKIAFDETGEPTKAAIGFARKAGVALEELELVDDVLSFQPPPRSIEDVLAEVLPSLVASLSMPKPMVWDDHRFPFAGRFAGSASNSTSAQSQSRSPGSAPVRPHSDTASAVVS